MKKMKKLNLLIAIIFTMTMGYSQSDWYSQNSGVNNYLFDVHFINQSEGWISGNTGLILHSTDSGNSWDELEAPANNTYYSIYFTDAFNGWATGYGGKIINTSDGGQSWNMQTPASSEFLYDIYFLDEYTGWAVGGDNGSYPSFISQREILFTNDGGQSWTNQVNESHKSPLKSVHFSSIDNGYAVGESGIILHTTDGGSNWMEVMWDQSYHMYDVYTTNSTTAYVIAYYLGLPHVPAIFKTTDGGETWTSQTFAEDVSLSSIYFSDDMYGWASGGENGAAVLLKTTDGGETWEYDYPYEGEPLTKVFSFDNQTSWSVGASGTVLSTTAFFTGFDEISQENDLRIYPNPATSTINVRLDNVSGSDMKLNILNINGQSVYEARGLNLTENHEIQIPVNNIASGLYQLVLSTASQSYSEKLVVR